MFKKVIYNTGAQVIAKGVSATTTLIVTLIIARTLGARGYGEFTKIFVFVGYFYTLADFGLNAFFVKDAAAPDESRLFRALIGLRILLSIALALIAILVTFFLPYDHNTSTGFSPLVKLGISVASLTIITQALFTTANALFQKHLRYDLSAIATVVGSLATLVGVFLLSSLSNSLMPFVVLFILGSAVYTLVSFILIAKKFNQSLAPIFDMENSKSLLLSSWPVGLALLLNLIYFRVDVLILSTTRTTVEVGIYGLAYQFFQAALAVPIFFANALYPLLQKVFKENLAEFKKQIRFWSISLVGFSILLGVSLMAVSLFIPTLFGEEFAQSKISLQILALGMPFFFLSALVWHVLIIHNKQKYLIAVYALGAVFNVAANLIFIPKYGFIAASTVTVISEALVLALSLLALKVGKK
ncbi:MAG: flippase [Candidatus Curtissbacteria bacterium]|nr:flippase [Candidatus Curtissbacteria bacterium]